MSILQGFAGSGNTRFDLCGRSASEVIAGVDRAFQGEALVHICGNGGRELMKVGKRQGIQSGLAFDSEMHCATDNFVGITEWYATPHEVIGQISRGGIAFASGAVHGIALGFYRGNHVGKGAQTGENGVQCIEKRFFVFLVVFVVGERLAFHQGEQGDEVAVNAPRFAAH